MLFLFCREQEQKVHDIRSNVKDVIVVSFIKLYTLPLFGVGIDIAGISNTVPKVTWMVKDTVLV